jgi:sulfite reductase alpha subunit-like flavoprotein
VAVVLNHINENKNRDAKHMAADVNKALETMAMKQGGLSEDKARQWVKSLRNKGRFLEDVWS